MKKQLNKLSKILIIFLLLLTFTGCTKILKDKDNKAVRNEETGQSITENILCRPTDKEVIDIYKKNDVDISKLPECTEMKLGGEYEGLWTNIFVRPLAYIIVKLGALFESTAIALIAVTIAIRLLLYPVTRKTAMQSEVIKEAQPELDKIEKKYKDKTDSESINKKGQEMMMVYQKYKINPLSGCIFAIIQLPLLFAFLEAINRVPAIFEETFLGLQMGTTPSGGIANGNYYYLILIVLILATTYFSFNLNKSTANPETQKQNNVMMIFMVVFIGFASFSLSAAVAVYWITSSLFTILQNVITDKLKGSKK